MNNYQAQQINNINSIIGFVTSIMFVGFVVGMTKEWVGKILGQSISTEFEFGRRSIRDVLENPKEKEYYVLAARYYPIEFRRRALKLKEPPIDEWDRDLAPSPELLGWWREGLRTPERWTEYTRRFLREVPPALIKKKAELHGRRAQGKTVVFVCTEESWEYPYCHTWILLDVLKEEIKKLGDSNE